MTAEPEPASPPIATDLVEYFVLAVPGPHALTEVLPGLGRLVSNAAIRILDLVVVKVDEDGTAEVVHAHEVDGLEQAQELAAYDGVLLSRHDIELITMALQPGDFAVVVVAEDRWAEPLAAAARAFGGEVRAGERIARERVQAALDRTTRPPEEDPP